MKRRKTLIVLMSLLLTALLVVGSGGAPVAAEVCCTPCHGSLFDVHGDFNHSATLGSGPVDIFDDFTHDDAWWGEPSPQFDVVVDCTLCHNTDLPAVHGGDCATCHPTPYDTIDTWNKGCQQGGCHATYHGKSTTSHLPFEDAYDSTNICSRCHDSSWAVTQNACKNCHAVFAPGDTSAPTTTSNAKASYIGPAEIDFSITDNGKVGVGRTFYQLDGGAVTAAGKTVLIVDPGDHQLTFWSKDQSGNTEQPPNTVLFTVGEDNTPPTTTSDAKASYSQGATINLTATDDGAGVKGTYYSINGGETQTGTTVVIPATSGTFTYTLSFWSEDNAGNSESPHTVNFTVTSGGGILRLVWGDSDTTGVSPCDPTDPGEYASWTIRRGTTPVTSGNAVCPGWSGVNDITVPVSPTPYSVLIDWWNAGEGYMDQSSFSNISVTTPGDIIRISY